MNKKAFISWIKKMPVLLIVALAITPSFSQNVPDSDRVQVISTERLESTQISQPARDFDIRSSIEAHQRDHHRDVTSSGDRLIHIPADYFLQYPDIKEAYDDYLRLVSEGLEETIRKEVAETYAVGDTRLFHTYNHDESTHSNQVFDELVFELRAAGDYAQIWIEQEEYQNGAVSDAVIESMLESLEIKTPQRSVNPDQGIVLNNIDYFAKGDPSLVPNPSGSGLLKVLVYPIRDGYDPEVNSSYVAGFFIPTDLAPNHPNGNKAAIIYINTRLLRSSSDITIANSTIAHEFQHLIHARNNPLNTFMNEGQSEFSEILNGYKARAMTFINNPDEMSGNVESDAAGGFFRWRTGENEALMDYQRAQLFHTYMSERIGMEATGAITQSSRSNPWVQYQSASNLAGENFSFRELLTDFYITVWLNNRITHERNFLTDQIKGIRMTRPSRSFANDGQTWVQNERVSLRYGGAEYLRWNGIEGLELTLDTPSQFNHVLITESNDGTYDVIPVVENSITLDGSYQEVVLVSVNTVVTSTSSYGIRHFTYSANWTPGEMEVNEITYALSPNDHSGTVSILQLPFQDFDAISVRINPEKESQLLDVDVNFWWDPEGQGKLQTVVTKSVLNSGSGPDAIFLPNQALASTEVRFDELHSGTVSIDFSDQDIWLEEGQNYHIFFKVIPESDDALLTFTFDPGSNDKMNTNYYPVRTLLSRPAEDNTRLWTWLTGDDNNEFDNDHKNLWMSVRLFSRSARENLVEPPVSDRFELVNNYPNPFNNQTIIELNIPADVQGEAEVLVEIYDVLGRRVQTVTSGTYPAGRHQLVFRAEGLPAGVYLARLQSGNSTDVQKMMYLK